MVLKTTFGQFQRWSLIRDTLGVENEEKNNLNLANKVFNRQNVLILGGLKGGISLYIVPHHVACPTGDQLEVAGSGLRSGTILPLR